jgi:hypothetical protein
MILTSDFQHLAALGNGVGNIRVEPMTDWLSCVGLDKVRSLLMGVVDKCPGELDLTNALAGRMYVRFGVGYNLSSGTTLSEADVRLAMAYNACGSIVGSRRWT